MSTASQVLLLSLEKRFNFSVSSLSVEATGYRDFLRRFHQVRSPRQLALDPEEHPTGGPPCSCPPGGHFTGWLVPLEMVPQVVQGYDREEGEDGSSCLALWVMQWCASSAGSDDG